MKKLFTFLAFVTTLIISAQAPQGFNYQATVRNSSGVLIINQNVNFKFNVVLNSQTSIPIYSETHFVPTDELGQVNLVIGTGSPTKGIFSSINWGNGVYYLGIELNTGSGYVVMGTTQLLSVPYALHANTSNTTTVGNAGLTHYIGELFGGGIVVSVWKIDNVEHGLVASLVDLSAGIQWTKPAFQSLLTGSIAKSFKDGFNNTNEIIVQAGDGTSFAAGLCKTYNAGGYNDWYLPAINELKQCYNSIQIINEVLGDNGFQYSTYWSSTGREDALVWHQDFIYCHGSSEKNTTYRVRAVRRF